MAWYLVKYKENFVLVTSLVELCGHRCGTSGVDLFLQFYRSWLRKCVFHWLHALWFNSWPSEVNCFKLLA